MQFHQVNQFRVLFVLIVTNAHVMTPEERLAIKNIIEEKIRKLTEDIDILKEHMKPVTLSCVVDSANKMDAINNNAVREAAFRNSLNKLNMLSQLAKRIHEPDFGNCRRCGNPINHQRLQLLPESSLCANG